MERDGYEAWLDWQAAKLEEEPLPAEPGELEVRELDDADADRMVATDAEYEYRTTEGAEA